MIAPRSASRRSHPWLPRGRRAGTGLALLIALVIAAPACGGDGPPGAVDAGVDAAPDGAPDTGVDPRFAPLVASLEQERTALGVPGVAVAVIEGGEVTFAAGFGSRHPDRDDPVAPTTLFRIGSVTKVLTAVGLLQQVGQGRASLDASLVEVIPEFTLTGDATGVPAVRVEDLLTHGSGIRDYLELQAAPGFQGDQGLSAYLTGPFADVGYLMAPPGRFWNYTNPGYMLAGLVLEVASDTPYRRYLTDAVLAPLGMARTFFLPEEVLADGDYAYGDGTDWGTGQPMVMAPDSYENPWARPAGYAWSSVLDLARFVGFLREGAPAVLPEAERLALMTPQRDLETFLHRQHYGYGLFVLQGVRVGSDFYEVTAINHGGAIPGYSADLWWFPELDCGVVTLANGDGGYFTGSVITALLTLCDPPAPTAPPDLTVDPADFARYVGDYFDPHQVGPVSVTRQGDSLRVAMPWLDEAGVPYEPVLVPVLPHNFQLTLAGSVLQATFILDGTGQAEYLRTRPAVAARVGTAPPPAPPFLRFPGATRVRAALARALRRTAPPTPAWRLAQGSSL